MFIMHVFLYHMFCDFVFVMHDGDKLKLNIVQF